jgi:hypothetical protein
MNSLRARLFAATLAALALTLALTIAIGAVLTRRQVDKSQAASVARRADDLAYQRRQNINYKTQNEVVGNVRTMIQSRPSFRTLVPDVNKNSDGETTYQGQRQLYSYRTIPHLGLLLLRPASLKAAAWRPFLGDHRSDPTRRRSNACARRRPEPRPAPDRRHDRARLAGAGVQPDDRAARRLAAGRTRLPALREP